MLPASTQDAAAAAAAAAEKKSRPPVWRVVASVVFYMLTSITMVMVNKLVLNSVEAPLTFLWLQIVVAVGLLYGCVAIGWLKAPTFSFEVSKALMPMIGVNVLGLSLNTLCLQYVNASFYQVARSLILPFTVLLSWLVLKKASSMAVLGACGVVFLGFIIGVGGEIELSWAGVFFGVSSSVTTAMHAVVIKQSLVVVDQDTMKLVFYNNVLSALALMPLIPFTSELGTLHKLIQATSDSRASLSSVNHFIIGTIVAGLFGFLINIAGFLQIQVTSPVTHMISSAVRGVLQTLVAVAIFHNVVTMGNAAGIALILAGSSLYTWIKSKESSDGGH